MRIAFISDIHGNFTALQAVVADLKTRKVDLIVCLGDTVSLGPQPKETLDRLRDVCGVYINGNHDQAILNPADAARYDIADYLVPALRWGREQLTAEDLEFIRSFVNTHEVTFPNGIHLLAYHGSPLSNTDIIQATTPSETLDKYFNGQTAAVFIGGHSHIQMHRRHGTKLILNAGSVGTAFKFAYSPGVRPILLPWAEYAIVEQSGNGIHAEMRRVYFDTGKLLQLVEKSSLPGKEWWLRQYQS